MRDLHERLHNEGVRCTTTVEQFQVMHARNLPSRDDANRSHVHRAAASREGTQAALLEHLEVLPWSRGRKRATPGHTGSTKGRQSSTRLNRVRRNPFPSHHQGSSLPPRNDLAAQPPGAEGRASSPREADAKGQP